MLNILRLAFLIGAPFLAVWLMRRARARGSLLWALAAAAIGALWLVAVIPYFTG